MALILPLGITGQMEYSNKFVVRLADSPQYLHVAPLNSHLTFSSLTPDISFTDCICSYDSPIKKNTDCFTVYHCTSVFYLEVQTTCMLCIIMVVCYDNSSLLPLAGLTGVPVKEVVQLTIPNINVAATQNCCQRAASVPVPTTGVSCSACNCLIPHSNRSSPADSTFVYHKL